MGFLDKAMSTVRRTQSSAVQPDTPFPDLSAAQGSTTAQAARSIGGVSPEAAAYNAQPKGAFPTSAAAPTLETRLSKLGESKGLVRAGGALQSGLAVNNMMNSGVGADNLTDLASGAAKFAGPAGVVGSTAFDVGKMAGKTMMPDAVATGLAKAYNYVTGNGDRNRGNLSTVQPNFDEIQRVATANPNGATANMLNGGVGVQAAQTVPHQNTSVMNDAAPTALQNDQRSSPNETDELRGLVGKLATLKPSTPSRREPPTAVQNYAQPPELDTGLVAGDATGIATLAKIAAQHPKAAAWAAGMKKAKQLDASNQKYDEMADVNARASDVLMAQGLGKAVDIYAQQAQRQHERGLAMNKLAYDRASDTEKRYEKRVEDTFGPAFDKDGKPNVARQKFDTALNAYLDQAGVDKRQLDPSTFEKILLSSQSAAYNPSPGVLSQIVQKALGGSTAATTNSMDATQPTGETALGGLLVKTKDERYKLGSDVHGGGTVTDLFSAPNREVQSRFAKEAAAAKRRQGSEN